MINELLSVKYWEKGIEHLLTLKRLNVHLLNKNRKINAKDAKNAKGR